MPSQENAGGGKGSAAREAPTVAAEASEAVARKISLMVLVVDRSAIRILSRLSRAWAIVFT
jgi:hypothetical protein